MRRARGMTLIEVMVALGILAVGLLAMWRMHMLGMSSTASGRRQTSAATAARELISGLERLQFSDPLLSENGATGPAPYASFGQLVDGWGNVSAAAHVWDDANPIPGVRASNARELAEASARFTRRWSVWGFSPAAGGPSAVRVIGVSVTWMDPPFARPREVVEYTYVANPAAVFQNLGANL